MCTAYPANTQDYDYIFLAHLLHAVFSKEDLLAVADSKSLKTFSRPALSLVKSNVFYRLKQLIKDF